MISSCKRWLGFSIVVFFVAATTSSQQGWFWQYPKPQGNTLNDIFIFDENTAIAVGEIGTVIKTTDGGESWDVQHHAGGSPLGLEDVHFLDSWTGWVVRNDAVLKTTDGGESWTTFYNGTECSPSLVYFVNKDTGFVFGRTREEGYGYGVCGRTTDGGKSWSFSRFPDLDIRRFTSAFFTSRDTGWVTAEGFNWNQLYKTVDGGISWSKQTLEPRVESLRKIQFVDENIGFIVGRFGVFLKTTDGGETWEYNNLFEKYQKSKYQFFYSVHFVDSLHGWIVGGDHHGYILRTTDGGDNWEEEDMDIPHHLYEVSFSDPIHGWIVGQFGLIYRTTDGGENWVSQREEQYSFRSIYFMDETTGWVVGNCGIILHTSDGGEYWHKQNEADSILLSSIYAIDASNVFAVGAVIKGNWPSYTRNGVILQTVNSGQTWMIQTFDTLTEFSSIVFINDSTGWITVTNGTLLKTTDKGNKWEQFISGLGTILDNMQFINESTGWISFYGGKKLLKTFDGGKNWNLQLVDTNFSMYDFQFINHNQGWSVGNYQEGKGNILKTNDGGKNWTLCGSPPSSYYYSVYFINENTGWVAGNAIIKTTDGGNTWIRQKSPSTVSSVYFFNENIGWAVGNGIFKTTNGGVVVSVNDEKEQRNNFPEQIELFQNYPNPFNPTTTIRFHLSAISSVKLKIFNILGKEVATLVDEELDAGSHRVIWDASQLASGIYFYRLQARSLNSRQDIDFMKTKKMILLH